MAAWHFRSYLVGPRLCFHYRHWLRKNHLFHVTASAPSWQNGTYNITIESASTRSSMFSQAIHILITTFIFSKIGMKVLSPFWKVGITAAAVNGDTWLLTLLKVNTRFALSYLYLDKILYSGSCCSWLQCNLNLTWDVSQTPRVLQMVDVWRCDEFKVLYFFFFIFQSSNYCVQMQAATTSRSATWPVVATPMSSTGTIIGYHLA